MCVFKFRSRTDVKCSMSSVMFKFDFLLFPDDVLYAGFFMELDFCIQREAEIEIAVNHEEFAMSRTSSFECDRADFLNQKFSSHQF